MYLTNIYADRVATDWERPRKCFTMIQEVAQCGTGSGLRWNRKCFALEQEVAPGRTGSGLDLEPGLV